MSSPVRLASFCRLCLSKTKDKVPVFADGDMLGNLLHLIEIEIDPKDEPDAVVCYDCVVTLEGFHQFKEQCHVNDEFVKTVPSKPEGSASTLDITQEEEEEENNQDGLVDENIEEEDRLELSEAEEVFQEMPIRKAAKSIKKSPTKGNKQSPPKKLSTTAAKNSSKKKQGQVEVGTKKPTLDELQVLADSYPDYFYFEKGSRSIYYTLVFYGERYNSALFNERNTYWQCVHRRRYQCPAQVWATNDYKSFERRFEHTHGQVREKEGQPFTPHEALPEIFQICKRIVEQKRFKNVKLEVSFEGKFQEFAADKKLKSENADYAEDTADETGEIVNTTADDSSEEVITSEVRSKRKRKPNSRYSDGANLSQKRSDDTEIKRKRRTLEKEEEESPKQSKTKSARYSESESAEISEVLLEEDETMDEELDLEKIEQECEALRVPRKPSSGPPLEEQLVLADSYPDFFYFEKGPRSIYYTMVYYGERFNSAMFTENFSYWQCQHRRKYKCPAQVCVTNDYKSFERRYEHTHSELPEKEGQPFTPKEALPEVFEACKKVVLKNRAKRRKKLLEKYKYLRSLDTTKAGKQTTKTEINEDAADGTEDEEVVVYDVLLEDEMDKEVEYVDDYIEESED